MGSLREMGGPVIGKQYCSFDTAQYTIKHVGKRPTLSDKWEMIDVNGAMVFEVVKLKTSSNTWSFKYETRVVDAEGKLVTRFRFTGSKWEVFDGESDDIICTVKEEKLNLRVFRSSNLQGKIPDYKTKSNNISLCMPLSLLILHGKEPLAEVLKKSKWLQPNEYIVALNEGADMAFVLLLVLMMHDMERMSVTMNAVSQIYSL